MNDIVGFVLLGLVIVGVVSATIAYCKFLRRRRLAEGVTSFILASLSLCFAMPFRNTHETPWIPGVVVLLYLSVIALTFLCRFTQRYNFFENQIAMRLQLCLLTLLIGVFFWYGVVSWSDYVKKGAFEKQLAREEVNAWNPTINVDLRSIKFDNEMMTDDDLPRMISGFKNYIFKINTIDFRQTAVSNEGVKQLRLVMPECEFLIHEEQSTSKSM